jgi:DNA helicase INO80
MDNNFRSTVLQRPGGDEDDRDRHNHRRDMMTAGNSAHRGHSSFNLRSPTQSEFHHPPPFTSPGRAASSTLHHSPSQPTSRQPLHTPGPPYMSSSPAAGPSGGPVAPTLPPPGIASSAASASASSHHPVSPLHPPSGYYPPPASTAAATTTTTRDKAAGGSFYDPTTDTTKDRRVSDSWHGASHAATTPKVSNAKSTSFSLTRP